MRKTHWHWILMVLCASLGMSPVIPAQTPTLQREFTIGCEDCGGALEFQKILDLSLSPRGDLLIVNADAPMLRLFDASGKAVWQTGAKGKGPGEYTEISRTVFLANGGVVVLDASGFRITTLSAARAVVSTTPIAGYPTTASSNANGTLLLGAESRRGDNLALTKWQNGTLTKVATPVAAGAQSSTVFGNSSVAISSAGTIAVMPNSDRYEIFRIDSLGTRLPDISRAVERVPFSAAEEAARKAQTARIMAEMAEMAAARSGKTPTTPKPIGASATTPTLKSHTLTDGLRYDAKGRLWVYTMRGDETKTVFDIFSANGALLGSVTIPEVVKTFALGGNWLATSSENANGIPVVTKWSVR